MTSDHDDEHATDAADTAAAPAAPSNAVLETRRSRRAHRASPTRHRIRLGINAAVILALVGGTGAFALAQDASLADEAPAAALLTDESADAADDDALAHLSPWASRNADRPALEAGDGVTFTVIVDGEAQELHSGAATVGEALAQAGIVLGWDDEVSVELASSPEEGAEIRIGRVTYEYVTEEVVAEHETQEREDSTLSDGTRVVLQEGADGLQRVSYRVRLIDGAEADREVQLATTLSEPVTEIVRVGTRPAAGSDGGEGSEGGGGTTPPPAYDGEDPRSIAARMVAERGWGDEQFQCLDSLWMRESNWNPYAQNPSSGAYGIPQSLPGSKMASAGADWQTNPATQITWGLGYIADRYGTPCGAWQHSEARGWY